MKRSLLVCVAVACSAKGQGPAGPGAEAPATGLQTAYTGSAPTG